MLIMKRNLANRGVEITAGPDQSASREAVVYDLHVGDTYLLPGDLNEYEMKTSYTMRPGGCIIISAMEHISVPDGVFGQICSRGTLAMQGLFVANTKVDPLFSGRLSVALFNAGNRKITVSNGQAFCSVFFQTTEQRIGRDIVRGTPVAPGRKRRPILDFLANNQALIWTSIVTIAVSALGAWIATAYALRAAGGG